MPMPQTHSDRDDMLRLLDEERQALLADIERVPVARREERPSPTTWSVAEVLEHLAHVERGIAKLIAIRGREQPPAEQPAAAPLDDARIARLRGREARIEAPERVRPSGTMSASEALGALEDARAKLRDAVIAADSRSLDACTHAHAVLGVLTLRDWVRFVAHHEARHAAQVAEIARALAQ
jgi:uncharacterized damage-inducible protein DinB